MIVLAAVVAAAALLLLRTGSDHLRHPATLARVLANPAAGARRAPLRMARGVAVVEVLVGSTALAALLLGSVAPGSRLLGSVGSRAALAAQGLLYLGFATTLWIRYRRGDRDDCGCTTLPSMVGPTALARAVGLALASLVAALVTPAPTVLTAGAPAVMLVAAGAGVLSALLHALPAAIDGVPRMQPGRAV